jgi:hypothetical protein
MNRINRYLMSIVLLWYLGVHALSAGEKEPELTAKPDVKNESVTLESEEGESKKKRKKKSKESYLEKVQRRYVSRLPYTMVPLMVVPIIKKGELAGYLTIMVELKGAGIENYRKLQGDSILVRDEIFCDLYFAMSRLWLGPDAPEAQIIENRIKKRINKYYKSEIVEKARLHVMQFSLLQSM